MSLDNTLRRLIREVPNFPKPGIRFQDITPVLQDPIAFNGVIETFANLQAAKEADVIAAFDARGFLFGAPLAVHMKKPLSLIRKKGKLPYSTISQGYDLEYGSATVEMHIDAVIVDDGVFLIDDLLATGGTARAGCQLVETLGGVVTGLGFVIELKDLGGREILSDFPITSLVAY